MYDKPEVCKTCGGRCCKQCPGASSPSDFGLPGPEGEQRVKAALATGRYCIDWWEGDAREGVYEAFDHPEHRYRSFYIRPCVKGKEQQLTDTSWGGMCTFWVLDKGCELSSANRPHECQMLEPGEADNGTQCKSHLGRMGRRSICVAWMAYDKLFEELLKGDRR